MNTIELEPLLDTKEKRSKATEDLKYLRSSSGWQLIKEMLNILIVGSEKQILSDEDMDAAKEKELKLKRINFIFVRDLPDTILRDLLTVDKQVEETDDPY